LRGVLCLNACEEVKALTDLAHQYDVYVSTGGWIERVLTQGNDAVEKYIKEVKELGFDMIEISTGFITLPTDDLMRLVEKVVKAD